MNRELAQVIKLPWGSLLICIILPSSKENFIGHQLPVCVLEWLSLWARWKQQVGAVADFCASNCLGRHKHSKAPGKATKEHKETSSLKAFGSSLEKRLVGQL